MVVGSLKRGDQRNTAGLRGRNIKKGNAETLTPRLISGLTLPVRPQIGQLRQGRMAASLISVEKDK